MKRRPVRWSEVAILSLREIVDRIAKDSPARAKTFGQRLIRSVSRLGVFPASGRKVPELEDQSPQPREILVGEYRVLYRSGEREVEIAAIFHGRRLLPL